jgi:hypothetical protein
METKTFEFCLYSLENQKILTKCPFLTRRKGLFKTWNLPHFYTNPFPKKKQVLVQCHCNWQLWFWCRWSVCGSVCISAGLWQPTEAMSEPPTSFEKVMPQRPRTRAFLALPARFSYYNILRRVFFSSPPTTPFMAWCYYYTILLRTYKIPNWIRVTDFLYYYMVIV